jgi:hypothetical protein
VPEAAAKAMSLYLLFAIGFKGGVSVANHGLSGDLIASLVMGVILSFLIPFVAYALLRATAQDGTLGHPVIFPADLRAAFATLSGDQGARTILQAHAARLHTIALPGHHALTDLDTPEAWAVWTQSRTLLDR